MSDQIRRALISVSDKSGILEFARFLADAGVEILSTGGTAGYLADNGIAVLEVSDYTGFSEMMDGRVKTLHPLVHGGILARRGQDDRDMVRHGIRGIDLVVVNLYPFRSTVEQVDCTLDMAIENIDIGGPAMLRSAAKNHRDVTVVVHVQDYPRVREDMRRQGGSVSDALRFDLARSAFSYTAEYDGAIAAYLDGLVGEAATGFPETLSLRRQIRQSLRYGENPHQSAAYYIDPECRMSGISGARQLQGKELSFNNIADTDAALECVRQFGESPACVIVKHANPCGVAVADVLTEAYDRAYRTDPESAFGGVIAFNRGLDGRTVSDLVSRQFVEVVAAPAFEQEALSVLEGFRNIRALETGLLQSSDPDTPGLDVRTVQGGLLVQEKDTRLYDRLDVVTRRKPDKREMADLVFAWRVAKYVKSNAIVYATGGMTIGIGAGQMSRVNSARIAAIKAEHAGLAVRGAVMASDAFFPFRDGLDNAADAGIRAVIQPGGSVRDDEVIAAADEHGMAMVFTGMRHFRH